MKTRILGAAMLVVAASALAAPPQETAEQSAQPAAKPERKICRTEKATGSLTRRTRICLTEAQWRQVYDRTRTGHDDFVRDASGGCRAPNDPRAGTMCGG